MTKDSIAEIRRSALIVTTMSSFLAPLALATVNVALPTIGRDLSMDAVTLSWVATAYILSAAIFLVPFGRLADMYGRKRLFLLGMIIFTVASLCLAVSASATMLITFRVLQGTGGAMVFGTGVAILSSLYAPGERGRVLGINVAAVYLGISCGPFFGGIITYQLGWRAVFFANVPLGVFIILLTLWRLKGEWAEARGESFDLVGSIIYGVMLLAVMYGFSHLPGIGGFCLLALGVAGIPVFLWWERRVEQPVLDVSVFFNNRVFALSNLAGLVSYSATFAVGFLLSFYLQHVKGMGPQSTGFVLVSQPIVQAIFSPMAGKISDTVEPRIVASMGMCLTATGLFLLASIDGSTGVAFLIFCLILLGLGFAAFSSPNTNAIMGSVENKLYGVASATLATMRLLGQMFSMGLAMLMFVLYMGRAEITLLNHGLLVRATRTAFLVFGVVCVAGMFASLKRGRLYGRTDNKKGRHSA